MCKKYRCIIESGNKYAVIVEADSAKDAEEIAKEIIAEGDVMDILEQKDGLDDWKSGFLDVVRVEKISQSGTEGESHA
jgi:hypothetical protein